MRIVSGIVIEEEVVVPVAPVAPKKVTIKAGCYVLNSDNDQSYGPFLNEAKAQTWIDNRQEKTNEDGEDVFGVSWDDCDIVSLYTPSSS